MIWVMHNEDIKSQENEQLVSGAIKSNSRDNTEIQGKTDTRKRLYREEVE